MKHQDIHIEKKDPFANCKLDRGKYAHILSTVVNSDATGFVLAINGKWGTGKTTFVKMWKQLLENNGHKTIYFNAWENDLIPVSPRPKNTPPCPAMPGVKKTNLKANHNLLLSYPLYVRKNTAHPTPGSQPLPHVRHIPLPHTSPHPSPSTTKQRKTAHWPSQPMTKIKIKNNHYEIF